MADPWLKYGGGQAVQEEGPWAKYGSQPLSGYANKLTTSQFPKPQLHTVDAEPNFNADPVIDFLRPLVSSAGASAATAAAAPSAPFTMGAGPVAAGVSTYSLIDGLMQHMKKQQSNSMLSNALELKEGGLPATIGNSVENFAVGKLLEGLSGTVGRGVKALRNADQPEIYNFLPTTSQALKASGYPKSAIAAKAFEDLSLTAKQQALDKSAGAGFTQALALAKRNDFNFSRDPQLMKDVIAGEMPLGAGSHTPIKFIPGEEPVGKSLSSSYKANAVKQGTQLVPGQPKLNELNTFSKIDSVIRDPKLLEDTLTTAQSNGVGDNLKKSLQGYHFMKLFNDSADRSTIGQGATGNVTRINAQQLMNNWNDPEMQESLKGLYNSKQRADIGQFIKNVAITQDKVNANPVAKKLMLLHGGVALSTGLLTGSLEGAGIGSAATFISSQALGKLLTNPKTARIMVALAGGEPLGVSEQYASKLIANALQGATIAAINKDGSVGDPMIVKDGKMVPVSQ